MSRQLKYKSNGNMSFIPPLNLDNEWCFRTITNLIFSHCICPRNPKTPKRWICLWFKAFSTFGFGIFLNLEFPCYLHWAKNIRTPFSRHFSDLTKKQNGLKWSQTHESKGLHLWGATSTKMSHAMVHIYTNKAQDEVTDVMKFLLPFKEDKEDMWTKTSVLPVSVSRSRAFKVSGE